MKPANHERSEPIERYSVDIEGMRLPLLRFAARGSNPPPVLLLHGGNTNSELFHHPRGGLVRFLAEKGCDVWTLDWRASATLMGPLIRKHGPLFGDVQKERDHFTLDRVAEEDIPLALSAMRKAGVKEHISVLGFCLAGGALSMAIARGKLEGLGVTNVVLATMGLFYEVQWNGWIKAEDFIIERLLATDPRCRAIDPAYPKSWPDAMVHEYECWPPVWLGAPGKRDVDELFRRLSFCYGDPYARQRLEPAFEASLTKGYFGPIHLGVFLHASQMVRRGYAAKFNALDVIDRTRISKRTQQVAGSDLLPEHFRNKRVTCITGTDDRIWHRDSIDLMYEWLRNEATAPRERERHRKQIVPRYGHLDLFWGIEAETEVYPAFLGGLVPPALGGAVDLAAE
jgi:pimeloyl-ACP methyl ester carboxylesterase